MKKFSRNNQGFTLVELLVVIVVIGILATITLVAYTGLTTKARNAAFLSAFDTYEKTIDIYYGQHNSYPLTVDSSGNSTASPSTATLACLGTGYTQTSDFPVNQCYIYSGIVGAVVNSGVNTAFATVISSLPSMDSGTTYSPSGTVVRGLLYEGYDDTQGNHNAELLYFIPNDQTCGRGYKGSLIVSGQPVTECVIAWHNGARNT